MEKPNLIYTEIVINAPLSRVCKEFYDFESYNSWNPYITRIEIQDVNLIVTRQKKKSIGKISRKSETEFGWTESFMGKVVSSFHNFYIQRIDEHSTKFVQEKYFIGIASGLFSSISSRKITNGFIAMNEALKARCESTIGN